MRTRLRSFEACVVVALAGVVAALGACTTDYQENKEDPPWGWNSLSNKKQPGGSLERGSTAVSQAGEAACKGAGGTIVEQTTPCATSFKTDIVPLLAACGVVGCHGGASPANQPPIDAANPEQLWKEFASFKLNDKYYVNPCSTDPAESAIECNSNLDAPCGVVMPPGTGLTPDQIATINAWTTCGAPNN